MSEFTKRMPPQIRDGRQMGMQPREAWRSEELLGERTEVLILHNDDVIGCAHAAREADPL